MVSPRVLAASRGAVWKARAIGCRRSRFPPTPRNSTRWGRWGQTSRRGSWPISASKRSANSPSMSSGACGVSTGIPISGMPFSNTLASSQSYSYNARDSLMLQFAHHNYARIRMLSDEQIQQIHFGSLEILERTGVEVRDARATELLRSAGARVAGERVRVP
ncbi:MAG: hypothetical protein GTN78_07850, partial [Gemmatimonadales bacterium]|nr:hypothetical protein [Gemmatimonadales bacterium]